jgi:hypothetical protein
VKRWLRYWFEILCEVEADSVGVRQDEQRHQAADLKTERKK